MRLIVRGDLVLLFRLFGVFPGLSFVGVHILSLLLLDGREALLGVIMLFQAADGLLARHIAGCVMGMAFNGHFIFGPAIRGADKLGHFHHSADRGDALFAVHVDDREAFGGVMMRLHLGLLILRGRIAGFGMMMPVAFLQIAVEHLAQLIAFGGVLMAFAFLASAGQLMHQAVAIHRMDVRGRFFLPAGQGQHLGVAFGAVGMVFVLLHAADQLIHLGVAFLAVRMPHALFQAAYIIHDVGIAGGGMRVAFGFLFAASKHAALDVAIIVVVMPAFAFAHPAYEPGLAGAGRDLRFGQPLFQAADQVALAVAAPLVMPMHVFVLGITADDVALGVQAGVGMHVRDEHRGILALRVCLRRFFRKIAHQRLRIAGIGMRMRRLITNQKLLLILCEYGYAERRKQHHPRDQRGGMPFHLQIHAHLVNVPHRFPLLPVQEHFSAITASHITSCKLYY